ncbi:MAG: MFS transporter [Eggerthellaceae bacterium]|jgi:FSR family fosmidomycin resistance protein-like MFS transporter|nr:MFS transporter [Eggerthellaceae bacterium]MEE0343603.1 MFS transporter [Eggerthellaceae bacterium]
MTETPQHTTSSEAITSVDASEEAVSKTSSLPEKSAKPKQGRGYSYLMMVAHLCDDLNQGALVAVIPFLVLHNGYSYAEVTALLLASNAASAIIQPLFGWLGDKKPRPWLMALGIFLAGIGMAGVGVLPSYPLIMASAMLSGIGVAMFHPEGGRLGNLTAGEQKGKGMSIFAVGGKLGFTFGPLVATAAITLWGLPGTLIFIIPSTLCAAVLLSQNKALLGFSNPDKGSSADNLYKDNWVGFGFVMGAISCRSIMYYAFLSFIPLFLVYNLGQEEAFASSVISLFALVCAVGTIASGWAGQALGAKKLIIVSYACVAVEVIIFAFNGSLIIALILIALLALTCDISYPSAVAMGQSFVPHHLGMASGLSFGVMVCIGGLMTPVFGLIGDYFGLQVVMLCVTAIAILGIAITLFIPKNRPMR